MTLDPAARPNGATAAYRDASCELSACGRYRYTLRRSWAADGPVGTFVMLNPSTADGTLDDPTIRRCVGFARTLGCASLLVVNLYAYRATDPRELRRVVDPVGPANDDAIAAAAVAAGECDGPLIVAWGGHAHLDRVSDVMRLPGMGRAAALTKAGQPRHPLYLHRESRPSPWAPPAR